MSLSALDLLRLTSRSLRGNMLRSALNLLGVFMGVASVTVALNVRGITQTIISQRLDEQLAPNFLIFPYWQSTDRVRFTQDDVEFLKQRLSAWESISTSRWAGGNPVTFQDQSAEPSQYAVGIDFWNVNRLALKSGRIFIQSDFDQYRPVVVIDETLQEQLFSGQTAVGSELYIDRQPYTVVGVVEPEDIGLGTPSGVLYIPLSYHQALQGNRTIGLILVRPQSLSAINQLQEQAKQLFEKRYPGQEFFVWNDIDPILEQQRNFQFAARALTAVGAIALLISGVGIANIMLASVTERTSEIGLRRAIGATRTDILSQFLLEALVLSILGGMLAIGFSHSATSAVAKRFELPYQFDVNHGTIALLSAVSIGLGASLVPALRASALDPVQSLQEH